jgi:hypothetical protein
MRPALRPGGLAAELRAAIFCAGRKRIGPDLSQPSLLSGNGEVPCSICANLTVGTPADSRHLRPRPGWVMQWDQKTETKRRP